RPSPGQTNGSCWTLCVCVVFEQKREGAQAHRAESSISARNVGAQMHEESGTTAGAIWQAQSPKQPAHGISNVVGKFRASAYATEGSYASCRARPRRPWVRRAPIWTPQALVECVLDRKSTRLNSSHGSISYAVFCLKKKKKLRLVQC